MTKGLLLLLCCTAQLATHAQTISTIAGNGTGGYAGDAAAATAAKLNNPGGVAVDKAGNVYIADSYNNRIRKVSTVGLITTIGGNGTAGHTGDGGAATAANLKNPTGVAVDNSGNVYVLDFDNNVVRKITSSGTISNYAGTGSLGFAGDGGPATDAQLYKPNGIYCDGTNVYLADGYNHRVRKIDASGTISTIAGNGTMGYAGDGGGATSAKLNSPGGVCTDASGNVYIGDKGNNVVRKINSSGDISTFAGNNTAGFSGDGAAATAAQLNKPSNMKADKAGNIYIIDLSNNRIRKVDVSGKITTYAGITEVGFGGDGGPATAAKFTWPTDIAIDTSGNFYIADAGNNRIRKITLPGTGVQNVPGKYASVSLFPNPSMGSFSVELPVMSNHTTVTISDMSGRVVEQTYYTGAQNAIHYEMANAVKGTYIVRIYADETLYTGKLVIQ